MLLVTALGNPGEEYAKTKHNAGWIVIDRVVDDAKWMKNAGANAMFVPGQVGSEPVEYIKPLTFMNLSGNSVSHVVKKEKLKPEQVIVLHDEIDLPIGSVRISFDRGAGGHNGITSIQDALGTAAFVRIRIGVSPVDAEGNTRRPTAGAQHDFVLKNFNKVDFEKIEALAPKVKEIIETIANEGLEKAMNTFN